MYKKTTTKQRRRHVLKQAGCMLEKNCSFDVKDGY